MRVDQADYVIVGAGSAGCVLANRLSANPKIRVVLIEAGGSDRRFWIKTPLGYAKTYADARVNWCYSAEADPGLNDRKAYWPRGRVLGGSSSINAMAYMRGLPHDFDDWAASGADGWGWETIARVYKSLEHRCETGPGGRRRHYGSGPVWVSDLRFRMHPFTRHFLSAANDLGWPVLDDANDAASEGLALMRSTVKGSRRWSAADAFLHPVRHRPNLLVVSDTLVEKVLVEGDRAIGVSMRCDGEIRQIRVQREVIVSAGAINSPQLLQLSGLGAGAQLQALEIPVVADLPQVGQGLQDHLAVSNAFRANEPTLNNRLSGPLGKLLAGARYVLAGTGPLSVPVNQCSGYVRSHAGAPVPDLQIYCNPLSYRTGSGNTPELESEPGFLLSAQPCRPTSRGHVTVISPDPAEAPAIQPNSLSTQEDREAAIYAGRTLARLADTPTLRAVTQERLEPDVTMMDDEALLETFRRRAGTVYHPCCTCRMGQDKTTSVTDARLRVHGVRGLRVVDASAFPNITSGNINAPTMMLAARASDLILEDAKV